MKPRRGKFFWKLFLGNAILLVIVVASCVWLIVAAFDRFYERELTHHLMGQARILRQQFGPILDREHARQLDRFAKAVGADDPHGTRITLVLADGTVLADSIADPANMESHRGREEIRQAIDIGQGQATRWSHTLKRVLKYVAVRVGTREHPRGVVRVAMTVGSIVARTQSATQLFWAIAVVIVGAAVVLALGLAKLWTRPIAQITATAASLSHGDLNARATVVGSDELALLARSLNHMRDHLATQLRANTRQRRTLEYLLAQLNEGVVVANPDGRIRLINPAAAELLELPFSFTAGADSLQNVTVETCIRQHALQRMLLPTVPRTGDSDDSMPQTPRTVSDMQLQEQRITCRSGRGSITLLARASDIFLPDQDDHAASNAAAHDDPPVPGRLMVITDITALTRSIQMKTDFVANASHELRTPLTAIRGAVETLLAISDADESDPTRTMLGVIDRHSQRLEALVADLLELSRIESATTATNPETVHLGDLFSALEDRFAERIAAKEIRFHVSPPRDDDAVVVDPDLLRLVLDNLVDNALKFTAPGGQIEITATRRSRSVAVAVADDGCGIAENEHDRVFERFYQVEPARSGIQRGTGLGLAIVRHAVVAMGAAVTLKSKLGIGTTVTVDIPMPSSVPKEGKGASSVDA